MKKKKNNNKALRLILMLLGIAALVYLGTHMRFDAPQAQPAAQTAPQLTLLTDPPQSAQPDAPASLPPEETPPAEDGSYTELEDVAYYLHTYGHLPDNYMTKAEAEDAGWEAYKGNLWDVAYGTSIGGDHYGNYDGQLPKGGRYYEADVNYEGGYRGGERIVYTDDGDVWYTSDHYETFERIY